MTDSGTLPRRHRTKFATLHSVSNGSRRSVKHRGVKRDTGPTASDKATVSITNAQHLPSAKTHGRPAGAGLLCSERALILLK